MKAISIIGAAFGWGAQIRETEDSPDHVKFCSYMTKILDSPHINWLTTIAPSISYRDQNIELSDQILPLIEEMCKNLALTVAREANNGNIPLVIGGDHSVAIGTWQGIADAMSIRRGMGLIWVDAHMDSHTPQTSPSKAYHGMPLATLLGYGEKSLTGVGAVLRPEDVVLIGIRSYEDEERLLLERLGVKIFTMHDITTQGFDKVLEQAISIVNSKTCGFGISVDMDFFDPSEAPGVGSPEADGIKAADVLPYLHKIGNHEKLLCVELVEYNPNLDKDDITLKLLCNIIKAIFNIK